MKLRALCLVLASIFTVLTLSILLVTNIHKVRWDKVPVVGYFVLEVNLWPSGFDADGLEEPITWEQLDKEPENWTGSGRWFSFNKYTKNLLKDYMKDNNLGIVPGDWPDFKFTSNFEECLQTFEFVKLGESYHIGETEPKIENNIVIIMLCFSIVLWVIFLVLNIGKRRGDSSNSD